MRKLLPVTAAATALIFACSGGVAAAAAPAERSATVKTVSSVIEKTTVSTRYIDRAASISSCSVGTAGARCTIAKGKSASRSIQLTLGLTRKIVSGALGFSADSSVTTTVSCSSPTMKVGQVWRAYAVGTRHKYKAKKVTMVGYLVASTETSGWLYAFNPQPADIHCE
jgi:hypothetical protein